MSQAVLHRFQGNLQHSLRGSKIRVAHLQADDIMPASLQSLNAVCHGNRGGLANELELLVKMHGCTRWIKLLHYTPHNPLTTNHASDIVAPNMSPAAGFTTATATTTPRFFRGSAVHSQE